MRRVSNAGASLVISVLLGEAVVKKAVEPILGRRVPSWGKAIVNSIPMSSIIRANKGLGPRFITKDGTKQRVLVLDKQMPMLSGVGATGNGAFGWFVIKFARKIPGPPLPEWQAPFDSADDSRGSSLVNDDNDGMDNDTL